MTTIIAAVLLAALLFGGLTRLRRDLRNATRTRHDDQAIALTEPPAPGPRSPVPAPGHNRGNHMVFDHWDCGCLYTWTRQAGWVHEIDCHDDLRRLLTP